MMGPLVLQLLVAAGMVLSTLTGTLLQPGRHQLEEEDLRICDGRYLLKRLR